MRSKADISQLNLPQSQLDDLELFVLSDYSRHLLGDLPLPPKKELQSPLTDAKLCALNLFFGRDNELKIYHGNFLLMDNKHRKSFVTEQSKGCKFMPKMHQLRLAAGLCPNPLIRCPRLLSRNRGLLVR